MDEVAEAFAEFDLDKSGGLSLQELRAALFKLHIDLSNRYACSLGTCILQLRLDLIYLQLYYSV